MQLCALSRSPGGAVGPITFDLPQTRRSAYPQYVTISIPSATLASPSGEFDLRVEGDDQSRIPIQARGLGTNSQSPKWSFCEAVAPSGTRLVLDAAEKPSASSADGAGLEEAADGGFLLSNQQLRVEVGPRDSSIIRSITYAGRRVSTPAPLELTYEAGGKTFAASGDTARRVRVLAEGPVRVGVEVVGRYTGPAGEPGLDYRLRIELLADLPVVVIQHWFFHCLPKAPNLTVDGMGISLAMDVTSNAKHFRQLKHGLTGTPRPVVTNRPVDVRVGHDGAVLWRMADARAMEDNTDYPPYTLPPADECSAWFAAELDGAWCAAKIDDACDMPPKGMRLDEGRFDFDLWPKWAAPMQLPQGRSRSTTLRLAFGDRSPNQPLLCETVDAALSASRCETPLLLGPEAYARAGVFEQDRLLRHDRKHARFDDYLGRVACPPTVAGMFDLGDTPDPGYQTTYLRTGRRLEAIAPLAQQRPVQFLTGVRQALAPWSDASQFEPIWANNEYDVIWCIGGEIMRAGRRDLLPSLRWFARHAIEVDFVHYSDHPVKHRATPPHCARHTTAGAYPSHFWTEGLLQYYALTGDEDALAFARGIGDKIVQLLTDPEHRSKLWRPTRELGWALLALSALIEFDPAPSYRDLATEIADDLIDAPLTDDYIADAVKYSFGYASIVLGVDRWYGVNGGDRYRDWLVAFAQRCAGRLGDGAGVVPSMGLCILHAGYKHSGDADLVRSGMRVLEQIIDSQAWIDPPPYTKPFAMLYRPLSRFLADAAAEGLLDKLDYRF